MSLSDRFPVGSRVRYEDAAGKFNPWHRPCILEGVVANCLPGDGISMRVRRSAYLDTGECVMESWFLAFRPGGKADAEKLELVEY